MAKATGRWSQLVVLVVVALLSATACSGGGDDDGGGSEVSAGSSSDAGGEVKDDGKRRQLAVGDGGAPTAGEIVGTSAEDFAQKWTAAGATDPPPAVTDVDFASEVAVALFAGERPTGGWRIGSNVTVKIQGRFAAVVYEILGPGDGCTSTQALTHPYLVIAVKAANVRFESSERMVPCE